MKKPNDEIFWIGTPPRNCSRVFLQRALKKILAALRARKQLTSSKAAVLTIGFVSAPEMKKLNRRFRKKNKPTDVLSFEQRGPAPKGLLFLGDLVVCVPELTRQAKEHGHSTKIEAVVLIVHGLLHLMGFDHEASARDEKKMRALESAILSDVVAVKRVSSGLLSRNRVKG